MREQPFIGAIERHCRYREYNAHTYVYKQASASTFFASALRHGHGSVPVKTDKQCRIALTREEPNSSMSRAAEREREKERKGEKQVWFGTAILGEYNTRYLHRALNPALFASGLWVMCYRDTCRADIQLLRGGKKKARRDEMKKVRGPRIGFREVHNIIAPESTFFIRALCSLCSLCSVCSVHFVSFISQHSALSLWFGSTRTRIRLVFFQCTLMAIELAIALSVFTCWARCVTIRVRVRFIVFYNGMPSLLMFLVLCSQSAKVLKLQETFYHPIIIYFTHLYPITKQSVQWFILYLLYDPYNQPLPNAYPRFTFRFRSVLHALLYLKRTYAIKN